MIIYFSGTGNSFSVAKTLADRTNEVVVPLKKAVNNGDENITFVFPLYCYDIPPHVRKFLRSFEIEEHQSVSGICTTGGGTGNAEYTFNRIMRQRGIEVTKFLTSPMIDNSIPVFSSSPIDNKEFDEKSIINKFLDLNYKNDSNFNPLHKTIEWAVYNPVSRRFLKKKVIEDKCIGCGKCVRVCTNDNIQLFNKKAVIGKECTECFGCVHVCPVQAIYIRKPITEKSQYTNPNINIDELNQ